MKKILIGLLFLTSSAFASNHVGDWVKYQVVSEDGQKSIQLLTVTSFSGQGQTGVYLVDLESRNDKNEIFVDQFEVPATALWSKAYSKTVLKSCFRIGGEHVKKDYGQGKTKFCKVQNPGPNNSTETKVYGPIPVLGFAESYTNDESMIAIDYNWN